jgi:hypothetical protein
MFSVQGGTCAICRREFDSSISAQNPLVDHDHETGRVRALVCRRCNTMLGMAGDQVEVFQAAIEYLRKWRN